MINNSNNVDKTKIDPKKVETNKKPNETGGVYFSSHVKIFDPNTKEVLVQKRGDL
jgi:hypothetical protein